MQFGSWFQGAPTACWSRVARLMSVMLDLASWHRLTLARLLRFAGHIEVPGESTKEWMNN